MPVAVILTTYNQPAWLEKSLLGYAAQTHRGFELLIADDGSGEETRSIVESFRISAPFAVKHVWHPDDGFRKCEILNKAILATDAEYLIFSDGDCIPRDDFVAVHATLARPQRFLSGGMIRLSRQVSQQITRDDIASGRFARGPWLRTTRSRAIARVADAITPTRPTFNGHNSSAWRDDIVAVNGFDATMGYGGLDRALGERLENYGVRGMQIRHRAPVFHLDHDRPYRRDDVVARNRAVREAIRRNREVRARIGLAEVQS